MSSEIKKIYEIVTERFFTWLSGFLFCFEEKVHLEYSSSIFDW